MTYQFGRMEVRMRMARGAGILSTFFTYQPGSEAAGALWEEIDVEVLGKSNAAAWQSNILVGNPRVGSEQIHEAGFSLADGYHTFAIEWTPTSVVWKVDGVQARRTDGGQANQLTHAHNFHFNLWASDVASWAGAFDSTVLPQAQYVSWIRYYRYENGSFVLDWTDDFNTFDTARWSKANWTFDGNLVDFDPNNAVVKDGTLVLCLTPEGQTGCSGAVPVDSSGNLGGTGSGGAAGTGGGAAGGAASGAGGMPTSGGTSGTGGMPGTSGAVNGGGSGVGGNAMTGGGTGGAAAVGGLGFGGIQAAGAPPTGGTAPAMTGAAGGNTADTPAQSGGNAGCSCSAAGKGSKSRSAWWALGAALVAMRWRRKPTAARSRRL